MSLDAAVLGVRVRGVYLHAGVDDPFCAQPCTALGVLLGLLLPQQIWRPGLLLGQCCPGTLQQQRRRHHRQHKDDSSHTVRSFSHAPTGVFAPKVTKPQD
jgi:hypothetical protein